MNKYKITLADNWGCTASIIVFAENKQSAISKKPDSLINNAYKSAHRFVSIRKMPNK